MLFHAGTASRFLDHIGTVLVRVTLSGTVPTSLNVTSAELGRMTVCLALVAPDCSDVVRNTNSHPTYVSATLHFVHQKVSEGGVHLYHPCKRTLVFVAPRSQRDTEIDKSLIRFFAIRLNGIILFKEALPEDPLFIRFGPEDNNLRALVDVFQDAVLKGWRRS